MPESPRSPSVPIFFAGGGIVTGAATVIKAAGVGRDAGMAIEKYLAGGEWWDPNAPKPAEAPPAK